LEMEAEEQITLIESINSDKEALEKDLHQDI
jgi:hypothetical protein